jgi:hypothetical protein
MDPYIYIYIYTYIDIHYVVCRFQAAKVGDGNMSLEKDSCAISRDIITTISEANTLLTQIHGFGIFPSREMGHIFFPK